MRKVLIVSTLSIAAIALSSPASARNGEQIYTTYCQACHATGAAGAPKLGDKAAWAPRIEKGRAILLKHVAAGFNAMPPKGACMDCTEEELDAAIGHMLSTVQ